MLDFRQRLSSVGSQALGRWIGTRPTAPRPAAGAAEACRVVCIASGKGGTGKSVVATNLSLARAAAGERVLLVDFDAGLANAHLLIGVHPRYDMGHVMEGTVGAAEALVEGPGGMSLLSGGVGRLALANATRRELERLFRALSELEQRFDLIVVDHGAGLSYATLAHLAATSTLMIVSSHEVTGLSDAYATYKRALIVNPHIRVGMVVNRAPSEAAAQAAWERFRVASQKFLGSEPELIGFVPADPAVPESVERRVPVIRCSPYSEAAHALAAVAAWPAIDLARTSSAFYDRVRRALR
jgi:flagellar biosynthesis protein FlhG